MDSAWKAVKNPVHPCPPWYALSDATEGANVLCQPRGASIALLTTFVSGGYIRIGDRVVFDDDGKAYAA